MAYSAAWLAEDRREGAQGVAYPAAWLADDCWREGGQGGGKPGSWDRLLDARRDAAYSTWEGCVRVVLADVRRGSGAEVT